MCIICLMRPGCPNISCILYKNNESIIRDGSYFRKDDSRFIKRFKCKECSKKFSTETLKLEYKQKKRRINHMFLGIISSGVSQRRAAIICNVNKLTIARRLTYFAKKARFKNAEFLKGLEKSRVEHLQFDDLITYEHTKLKPLSVSVAVDAKRRFILGAEVAIIPSFGSLSKLSKDKYGNRKNEHREKLDKLFSRIHLSIDPYSFISSDKHKNYKPVVDKFFKVSTYKQYNGERATLSGLGELKKNGRDPLFAINHSLAMLRANINRLFRRTWCSTKSIEHFSNHLEVFIYYFNHFYLPKTT